MASETARKIAAELLQAEPVSPETDFGPQVWRAAVKRAQPYRVTISERADNRFIGRVNELPTVIEEGRSPQQCFDLTKLAVAFALADFLAAGQEPPKPGRLNGRRTSKSK